MKDRIIITLACLYFAAILVANWQYIVMVGGFMLTLQALITLVAWAWNFDWLKWMEK